MDPGVEAPEELLEHWVAGWARCRGYRTAKEHGHPAAYIDEKLDDWEYFAVEPGAEDFAYLAASTSQGAKRVLTVLTNDPHKYTALAEQHGLEVVASDQSMMTVDMETQDTEPPWLNDDDLKVAVSHPDGHHQVMVTAHGLDAAHGRVAVSGPYAVFDKIETADAFRRRGLGTFVMRALAAAILEGDVETGLLVASAEGRLLYGHLGWVHRYNVLIMRPSSQSGTPLFNG